MFYFQRQNITIHEAIAIMAVVADDSSCTTWTTAVSTRTKETLSSPRRHVSYERQGTHPRDPPVSL